MSEIAERIRATANKYFDPEAVEAFITHAESVRPNGAAYFFQITPRGDSVHCEFATVGAGVLHDVTMTTEETEITSLPVRSILALHVADTTERFTVQIFTAFGAEAALTYQARRGPNRSRLADFASSIRGQLGGGR